MDFTRQYNTSQAIVFPPPTQVDPAGSVNAADLTGRLKENSLTLAGAENIEQTFSSAKTIFALAPAASEALGDGLSSWWEAANFKFQPNAPLTTYTIRVGFKMKTVSMVQLPTVIAELDISAARDGSRVVAADQFRLSATVFKTVNLYFDVFAKNTFFTNGGQITLRTVDGDITAINPTLFIKGR